MTNIIYAVAVLGIMGLAFGLLLAFASKVFAVEVDERIPAVQECLPGANCGGCGYPGCGGLASAIVAGEAPVNGCPVGGETSAAKIAKIMGVEMASGDKMVAHVHCGGTCDKAPNRTQYEGIQDCLGAIRVSNGAKECLFGCLGLGTCAQACPFDAISIVDGIAKVDEDKCKACSKCVAACPKHLISLVPQKASVRVDCSSKAKGKEAMDACKSSCISCGLCVKTCKFEAISIENGYPVIDYSKCKNCKMCAKACPRHCIEPYHTAEAIAELEAQKKKQAELKKAAAAKAAAAKAETAATAAETK